MALRFMESFDHWPQSLNATKWTGGATDMARVGGRFGGSAINTNQRSIFKTIDSQDEWIIGFAFANGGSSGPFLRLVSGGVEQGWLYLTQASGILTYYRGPGSANLGSTSIPCPVSTWVYVELRVVVSNTVGVVQVRINGVLDLNLSSQDTLHTTSTIDTFYFGDQGASNINVFVDDIYICDATGSAPTNTFLGDCRVECLFPSGNGNSSQLVGQDANSTDNYLNVDETSPDGDTTYNESGTISEKDTYAYDNLATASGTVFGVQPLLYARKTDAGARSVASIARLSGTEVDSSDHVLTSGYTYHRDIRETKPGGGAWTVSDVNSAEFGVKITA